jgi:hypothetical protein
MHFSPKTLQKIKLCEYVVPLHQQLLLSKPNNVYYYFSFLDGGVESDERLPVQVVTSVQHSNDRQIPKQPQQQTVTKILAGFRSGTTILLPVLTSVCSQTNY